MKHIKISPQRYRWVIVAASFLMVFVCLGFNDPAIPLRVLQQQ